MVITTLHLQNYSLLVAGLINFAMSIFIIARGYKNKVNLYFSLLTFSTFLWSLSVFLARTISSNDWFFWSVLAYPAALGIAVSLFYFSFHFPFMGSKLSRISSFFILFPAIILSIISFIPGWFIIKTEKIISETLYILYYYEPVYIIYAFYFLIIILLAVYNFINKYIKAEYIYKKHIKLIIITIILGLIVGSYCDLFICYFGNFRYVWVGPIFTLLMNFAVFKLINSSKEKTS